jgi:hypothetical protein
MATTNGRDWVFTHAISESSFKTYEKSGLARRDTVISLMVPNGVRRETVLPVVETPSGSQVSGNYHL